MTAEGGPLHRFNDSTISEHAKAFGVVSSVSDSSCQRENLPLFRKTLLGSARALVPVSAPSPKSRRIISTTSADRGSSSGNSCRFVFISVHRN